MQQRVSSSSRRTLIASPACHALGAQQVTALASTAIKGPTEFARLFQLA